VLSLFLVPVMFVLLAKRAPADLAEPADAALTGSPA